MTQPQAPGCPAGPTGQGCKGAARPRGDGKGGGPWARRAQPGSQAAGSEDASGTPRRPAAPGAPLKPATATRRPEHSRHGPALRMSQPRALTVPTGALSVGDFRKVLMKTGLVLVVLGHVSFVTAALLHGTVLRHVAAPHDAVALQYCVVNILSVTCAIAVITAGIAAIVLSRYLPSTPLRWAAFSSSVTCALLSLTCALGLLASIAVTFATQGRALLAACTFGKPEVLALSPDCPFDPTRIYSSSLCLWGIALILCVAESVFAVRCSQLTHQLLELKPWWGRSRHYAVQENVEPTEGQDLLSSTPSVPLTL
ncbi:transmembrane protein 54 [Ochotona curzoniae]|uniref:transmembrane protein 54 n=1 Tax=Ochotona curzoniae TaxID=130825 RepID=UPI001B34ADB4|nr:transmembrane protein 54 [Ochotona curzoniae]